MSAHVLQTAMLAVLAAGVLTAGGCAAQSGAATPRAVLWHEGEAFASATKESEMQADERSPASGGMALYGGTLDDKDREVTWKVQVESDLADAQIIFRYARLHWRTNMKPAPMRVELSGPTKVPPRELTFDNTGGWGRRPKEFGLAAVGIGPLAKGKYTVKITSLADNNSITLDGFFIASADFKVTAEELAALRQLTITSDGFCGLRTAAIIRQQQEPFLWVAAEGFAREAEAPKVSVQAAGGRKVALGVGDKTTLAEYGLASWKCSLPELPDGDYTVQIQSTWPQCEVTAPLTLAGELLGTLDQRVKALEDWAAQAKGSSDAQTAVCLADIEHIVEYLKTNKTKLSPAATDAENPWKQGLAFQEGAATTSPVVANMRRALEQAEAAVTRVKAGKDPYEGVAGQLRRSYLSVKDGQRHLYRMFVPSSYAKADKVPLILYLHGGGGDEDYWPDMEGGRILEILEKRGYMAVMPWWHRRNKGPYWMDDQLQLIDTMRREYPKIDPERIYVTGISMGGFGTYDIAAAHPEIFAAACPISGTGDPAKAANLKDVPLLILQGGSDTVVRPEGAMKAAAEMKRLGHTVKLHVFPTYGHGYHADEYMKLTLDWFDKYRKKK